jgi:hypothetical protein
MFRQLRRSMQLCRARRVGEYRGSAIIRPLSPGDACQQFIVQSDGAGSAKSSRDAITRAITRQVIDLSFEKARHLL